MKKLLKKTGRVLFVLDQKNEEELRQSVLLVDGSFILPNNFALIIKGVKKRFKNADITVLTFKDKEAFIKDNFPDVKIIVPGDKIKNQKYQLAVKLLILLRRDFKFVVLSSLDISLLAISLLFARCPVFLHNRWMEWYKIRQRTVWDVLTGAGSTDINRRRACRGIKEVLKSLGRAFIILSSVNEKNIKSRILIADNGYTEIGHIITAVRNAEKTFINPDLTILAFARRKEDFINNFPQIKLVVLPETKKRYKLAGEICGMGRFGFDYVILTTLDVSPILSCFLFLRAEVLLYNRWHQWWTIGFMNLFGYFKEIAVFLIMIPVFLYLFMASSLILLRTRFRLWLINLRHT